MIRIFLKLTKFPLSAAVTLSALFAYLLAGGKSMSVMSTTGLAVLLLALGVSALNQYQEREADAKMARTKGRPIPSGRITPGTALALSVILILSATVSIYMQLDYPGMLLFLFVPLWYNGVYTSLKKLTAFAVVPGGLLGTIPPAVGWLAAGRGLIEPEFLSLALLFFVWQVPHFWLLSAKYDADYRAAGFPTAMEAFGPAGFRRVLFVWWMLTIGCALFVAAIFGVKRLVTMGLLAAMTAASLLAGIGILRRNLVPKRAGMLFHGLNAFLLGTVMLLGIDGF